MYLDLLGQPIIVLSTLEACTDLLDRRSAIYSDRPFLVRGSYRCDILPILPIFSLWPSCASLSF